MKMRQTLRALIETLGLALAFAAAAPAQTPPTSTGADGAYNATVSGLFDPNNLSATCPTCTANNVVNASGDNVFNFTTITIASGVTVRLEASKVRNMPVIWLATGAVNIVGTLDLTGDGGYGLNATNPSQIIVNRSPAQPGAGGYYGGLGARSGIGPEPGSGPGGGSAGTNSSSNSTCQGGSGASFSAANPPGAGNTTGLGTAYGNFYLVPLYGGSGGGGGWGSNVNDLGGGGGAGGGAIRIYSPLSISLTGSINVSGGSAGTIQNDSTACVGGAGAAGVIHLIAPTISGSGSLSIYAGQWPGTGNLAIDGYVRFNVTTFSFTGVVSNVCSGQSCTADTYGNAFVGPFTNVPANNSLAQPTLSITSVNGVTVPNPPSGQYLTPDVQISANTPVSVAIAGSNIPVGTVVTLRVTSESGGDALISCPGLAGTLASSTATCTATFPYSVSLATLRATW